MTEVTTATLEMLVRSWMLVRGYDVTCAPRPVNKRTLGVAFNVSVQDLSIEDTRRSVDMLMFNAVRSDFKHNIGLEVTDTSVDIWEI